MKFQRMKKTAAVVSRPRELVIVFQVGPYRLAMPAGALKEIRNDRGLAPRDFGCTEVITLHAAFGLVVTGPGQLLVLRREQVAFRVDRVEQLIEVTGVLPLPQVFVGKEREWFRGLAFVGEAVIPVIDPAGFLPNRLAELGLAGDEADCFVQEACAV